MKDINCEILDPYCIKLEFNSDKLNYPLNIYFTTHNSSNGEIRWETEIGGVNMWCSGPPEKGLDVKVIDSNGDIIFKYDWVFNESSDIVEKIFIKWCRNFIKNNGIKPKGIVIGTCDGVTGEWVEAYNQNLIGECLLIEPNIKPLLSLIYRYQNDSRFKFKKCVIGESNDIVDFFTDDSGTSECSSLLESNYLKHHDTYKKLKVKSFNPNYIFNNNESDWLHIDAEGYDGKILLLLNDYVLNKLQFIIWEHIHLDDETSVIIKEKLQKFGFKIEVGQDYNTCAYR